MSLADSDPTSSMASRSSRSASAADRGRHPCSNPTTFWSTTMQTQVAKDLGIEFPIFAFTHCRDVVVAVSKAGGLGVLGAVGFTPEQLATELEWIDEHIGDRPYGVDIVIPGKYEGMGELDPEKLEEMLREMVPHRSPRVRVQAPRRPRRSGDARGRAEPGADRLDRGDGDSTGARGAQAPERQAHRQRTRHPAQRDHRRDPQRRAPRRRAVRLLLPGVAPQGRRRGHHHRPGHRGRRTHR